MSFWKNKKTVLLCLGVLSVIFLLGIFPVRSALASIGYCYKPRFVSCSQPCGTKTFSITCPGGPPPRYTHEETFDVNLGDCGNNCPGSSGTKQLTRYCCSTDSSKCLYVCLSGKNNHSIYTGTWPPLCPYTTTIYEYDACYYSSDSWTTCYTGSTWTSSSGCFASGGNGGTSEEEYCNVSMVRNPYQATIGEDFEATFKFKSKYTSETVKGGRVKWYNSWVNGIRSRSLYTKWCETNNVTRNQWQEDTKTFTCPDEPGEYNFFVHCYGGASSSFCDDSTSYRRERSDFTGFSVNCEYPACTPDTNKECCDSAGRGDDTGDAPGKVCNTGSGDGTCWWVSNEASGFGFDAGEDDERYHRNCCGDDPQENFIGPNSSIRRGRYYYQPLSCDGTSACCKSASSYVINGQCKDTIDLIPTISYTSTMDTIYWTFSAPDATEYEFVQYNGWHANTYYTLHKTTANQWAQTQAYKHKITYYRYRGGTRTYYNYSLVPLEPNDVPYDSSGWEYLRARNSCSLEQVQINAATQIEPVADIEFTCVPTSGDKVNIEVKAIPADPYDTFHRLDVGSSGIYFDRGFDANGQSTGRRLRQEQTVTFTNMDAAREYTFTVGPSVNRLGQESGGAVTEVCSCAALNPAPEKPVLEPPK